jgi:hypothetical protein
LARPFFHVHSTTVGALTSIALAAIDSALWDLRGRKAHLPLHRLAGGAKDAVECYYTEGGWIHIDDAQLVEEALHAKERGFRGTKIKIGKPHISDDVRRLSAARDAVGPAWEIMTDANQGFSLNEAIRRARAYGKQPFWPDNLMKREIRPVAKANGIHEKIGWHTSRHSFVTLLKANGEDVKTVQELLRHANSKSTLDVYTHAVKPFPPRSD